MSSAVIVFIFSNLFLRFEKDYNEKINYQVCKRCVMDTSDTNIIFNRNGICDYCENFDLNLSKYFTKKNFFLCKSKIVQIILEKLKTMKITLDGFIFLN